MPPSINLAIWLADLAAMYSFVPTERLIAGYLEILETWHLSPELWKELARRAVMRFDRFPRIAELVPILEEFRLEAQTASDMADIRRLDAEMRAAGWQKARKNDKDVIQ